MSEADYQSNWATPLHDLFRNLRMRFIPMIVGAILAFAAISKALSPTESATLQTYYSVSHWAVIALVQVELLLAVLLIWGLWASVVRRLAIVMFLVFSSVALHRALAGYDTCGCLGSLSLNPWGALVIDAFVLASLVLYRPGSAPQRSRPYTAFIATCLCFVSGIVVVLYMLSINPAVADGSVDQQASVVVLEPESWIGQKFPLREHLVPPVDIQHGQWLVTLYHEDCPKCRDDIARLQSLPTSKTIAEEQLLLVEIPPLHSQPKSERGRPLMRVALTDEKQWFVETPVHLRIRNGTVNQVSRSLLQF